MKCDFDNFNSFKPKLSIFDIFDIFKEIITIWAKSSAILIYSIFLGPNFQSLISLGKYNNIIQIENGFDKLNSFRPKLSISDILIQKKLTIWAKSNCVKSRQLV